MKRAFGGIDQNSGRSSEDIMGGGWALLDAWPQKLCELETCRGTQHQRDDQWFADALVQRSHAQIRQLFASRTLGCYPFNTARLSSFNIEIQGVGNLSVSSEAAFSHWEPQSLMLVATSILRTMDCDGEEVNSKDSGKPKTWKLYNWHIGSYLGAASRRAVCPLKQKWKQVHQWLRVQPCDGPNSVQARRRCGWKLKMSQLGIV